ncbi:MAG: TlpA disulfide reductase family protein [Thermodesulfovibrionales bacterium]
MKNKKGLILLTIFFISVILIYFLTRDEDKPRVKRLIIGDTVSSFQLRDLEGKMWSLDELKGKVILLNFWATWCDTCKIEKPYFMKLIDSMKDRKDIVFLTVLYNDDEKKAFNFMRQQDYRFPVLIDTLNVASKFGVVGVPETIVIDKKGRYAQRLIGPVKWDSPEIKEALLKLAS